MSSPEGFRIADKVPVSSLGERDLDAYMNLVGYGESKPASAQHVRSSILQDPARRAWDPIHGEFFTSSDGGLYAAFASSSRRKLEFATLVAPGSGEWELIPHDDPHWGRLKRCYARFNE